MYRVRLQDNLFQLIGPLILFALLLGIRANRTPGAWAIWVSVIVINLLARAAGLAHNDMLSSLMTQASPVIEGMCYGFGAAWLLLGTGGKQRGGWWNVGWGGTVTSVAGFGCMCMANASGGDDPLWLFAIATGVSWWSLAVAGRMTRSRFTCMRWCVLTLCVLAASIMITAGIMLVTVCPVPIDGTILKMTFLVVCPVLSGIAAVAFLPYMLLCGFSRFYRERAMTVLGVSCVKPLDGLETAQVEPPAQP